MKYTCLNPIASVGLDQFTEGYEKTEKMEDADAVLVRSAAMHDLELPDGLYAVARAGAGVNNIPLDKCAEKGIVVFNTPGANANGVKELVIAGMLLASRDIIGGVEWAKSEAGSEDIAKKAEKEKRNEFKVFSLDQLDNNNTALVDKVADDNNQYDTLNINEEVENVMNIINQLSKEDRDLITNLLIKNKTERELSTLMGVSQPAIHKRKKRIIETKEDE